MNFGRAQSLGVIRMVIESVLPGNKHSDELTCEVAQKGTLTPVSGRETNDLIMS